MKMDDMGSFLVGIPFAGPERGGGEWDVGGGDVEGGLHWAVSNEDIDVGGGELSCTAGGEPETAVRRTGTAVTVTRLPERLLEGPELPEGVDGVVDVELGRGAGGMDDAVREVLAFIASIGVP